MQVQKSGLPFFSPFSFGAMLEENFPIGVFCVAGNAIVYCNATFRRLLKLRPDLAVREIRLDTLFGAPGFLQQLIQRTNSVTRVNDEKILLHKPDGSECWGSLNFSLIEDEHGAFYCGTILDCTSQINNEKLLRKRNEDLKKLNQQLDRFLYSASHDVRQPLTSMMGLIRLMRMQKLAETEADYLGKLNSSVMKLDQFLKQIMEFSRNSHERLSSEQVCYDAILEKVQQTYEALLTKKKISISIHLNTDNVFYSDPGRIMVALRNLIKNCIDYADSTKEESFVRVMVTCYEDRSVIEVIDNGIGIGKTHLSKVTEMFYRATDRSTGSGIGLYIVNEIVLKLEGTLSIDSEPSLGTIVRMELPNGVKGILINRKNLLANPPSPIR